MINWVISYLWANWLIAKPCSCRQSWFWPLETFDLECGDARVVWIYIYWFFSHFWGDHSGLYISRPMNPMKAGIDAIALSPIYCHNSTPKPVSMMLCKNNNAMHWTLRLTWSKLSQRFKNIYCTMHVAKQSSKVLACFFPRSPYMKIKIKHAENIQQSLARSHVCLHWYIGIHSCLPVHRVHLYWHTFWKVDIDNLFTAK